MRENQREDQIVSAIDTEIDAIFQQRRDALNRWMLQLPMKDRRRRWGEYLARICQLDKDVEREIALKRKPAVSSGPRTPITPPAAITASASSRSERLRKQASGSCNQTDPND